MSEQQEQRKEVATRAAQKLAASNKAPPQQKPRPEPRFQVLIECASEAEQEQLYHRLRQEGVRCRPLVTA